VPLAAENLALARQLVENDPTDEARLLIAKALFAWYTHQYGESLQHASLALAIAERAGAQPEVSQAYELLAISHLPLGHWEEGLRAALQWHTAGWSLDNMVAADAHLCLYLHVFHGEESLQQTRRFIETLAQQSATAGNQHCLAICYFALGNLALRQGLPDEAAESLVRALELHERIGSPTGVAYTLAQQVELLTAAGVHAPAPRLAERGIEAAHRAAMRDHCLRQLYAAGIRNRIGAGDAVGALALVEAIRAHTATSPPCAVCQVELCEALATFHLKSGEPEKALPHVEQARQLTGYAQSRPGRARLARAHGQIHAARGEPAEAERCLLEAAGLFRALGDQYDLALTLQALAAVDGGEGRTEPLRQAEAILDRYRSPSIAATLTKI
jgi:tetratricopeptide (TPR) repeat protein